MNATAARPDDRSVRTRLALGGTGVVAGIALAVLDMATLGAVATVGSLVLLLHSVHRFGREGADVTPSRRRRHTTRSGKKPTKKRAAGSREHTGSRTKKRREKTGDRASRASHRSKDG